jgi:glycosyltransferase involved in cell wall biosynthesis
MDISVVIPTLNRPNELLKCLESVFNQKLSPKEIYVIDNSKESLNEKILKKYIFKKKIIFLKMSGSVGQLRNYASLIAKSDYIAFLDDDDIWHKNYLKNNLKIIKNKNLDIIYSSMNIVDVKNNILRKLILKKYINMQELLLFNNGFFLSNMIVKKSVFNDLGGLNKKTGASEREILIKIIQRKYKYFFNKQILLSRQISEDNMSKDNFGSLKVNILFYLNYFKFMNLNTKLKYIKKIIKIFLSLVGYKKFIR